MERKPELLAPAGSIESFHACIESGADAVYLGLKKFSARAGAPNFSLDEVSTLIPFARKRGIRVYVALNSLVASSELPQLLDTLHAISQIKPDAVIAQDAAVFEFVGRHFPEIRLHASTLAAVHNSAGVNALERMGAKRIVLARELGFSEIEKICAGTKAELEIFVHGALCYSYSGLCLTSSFRGGRSGLRGECVQPCRLKLRQGKKEGFFLSCNDLCALPVIPRLKRLRIAGFKIEGRMKPAPYVAAVVKAYRAVLDASTEEEQAAIGFARELLAQAPSRHLTSGYLEEGKSSEILSPHRSGVSGIWVGTVKTARGDRILVDLRHALETGDRLRPESSGGREEDAFTVSAIFGENDNALARAEPGSKIWLASSGEVTPGSRLFKVATKSEQPASIWKRIKSGAPSPVRFSTAFPGRDKALENLRQAAPSVPKERENLIIKVGSITDLVKGLQSAAATVFLAASRSNLERIARQRFSPPQMKKLGLSLPALIHEEKDLQYYRAAVKWLSGKGFKNWEVNNWGHFDLFDDINGLRLAAGYRLNLRNEAALALAADLGCGAATLSLEMTRDELKALATTRTGRQSIITVYCWPPLFTSRLIPDLVEEKPFLTIRKDVYQMVKQAGNAYIYADKPVSLFEEAPFLRSLGFRNFLIDVSEGPGKRPNAFEHALGGFAAARRQQPYSRSNYDRRV